MNKIISLTEYRTKKALDKSIENSMSNKRKNERLMREAANFKGKDDKE